MTFRLAAVSLVGVALLWASSFAVTKSALSGVSPALFLALRATLGTLALFWVKPDKQALKPGLVLGCCIAASIVFELLALASTSASKVAFFFSFSTFIAPLFGTVVFKDNVPQKVSLGRVRFTHQNRELRYDVV